MQTTTIRVTNETHPLFGKVLKVWLETNAGFHVRANGDRLTIGSKDAVRCVERFQ